MKSKVALHHSPVTSGTALHYVIHRSSPKRQACYPVWIEDTLDKIQIHNFYHFLACLSWTGHWSGRPEHFKITWKFMNCGVLVLFIRLFLLNFGLEFFECRLKKAIWWICVLGRHCFWKPRFYFQQIIRLKYC